MWRWNNIQWTELDPVTSVVFKSSILPWIILVHQHNWWFASLIRYTSLKKSTEINPHFSFMPRPAYQSQPIAANSPQPVQAEWYKFSPSKKPQICVNRNKSCIYVILRRQFTQIEKTTITVTINIFEENIQTPLVPFWKFNEITLEGTWCPQDF